MKDSNNDPEAREQVYQSPGWSKHLAGTLGKITAEGFLDVIHMSSKKTRFYDRCLIHFLKIAMVIRCFFLVWSSPQVYKKSTRILDRCSTFGHMLHDFAFGLCCIFLLLLWFSNSWCVCFFEQVSVVMAWGVRDSKTIGFPIVFASFCNVFGTSDCKPVTNVQPQLSRLHFKIRNYAVRSGFVRLGPRKQIQIPVAQWQPLSIESFPSWRTTRSNFSSSGGFCHELAIYGILNYLFGIPLAVPFYSFVAAESCRIWIFDV